MDTLTMVALTLWWSEGSKSRRDKRWKNAVSYPIEITNTNPLIHKIFLKYLREVIKYEEAKIYFQLQIHEGDDKLKTESYWSSELGIPVSRFQKTIIRPVGNKPGKTMGTGKTRFSDKNTYLVLQSKLEELQALLI